MASVSLFWDTNMAAMKSCDNTLYSLFETQFWTDKFFTSATRLYGIVQILLQIALLFTAQKLARFREFRINERLIRETFCPFKICPNPRKRGLGNWVWCRSFILIYCGQTSQWDQTGWQRPHSLIYASCKWSLINASIRPFCSGNYQQTTSYMLLIVPGKSVLY